jgi:hypothetical protein
MIVRALASDGDVVDVALAKSGAGDAHEARLLLELRDRLRPDIAHGGAQASGELELMHDRSRRTAIGRGGPKLCDSFWHRRVEINTLGAKKIKIVDSPRRIAEPVTVPHGSALLCVILPIAKPSSLWMWMP